MTVVSCNVLPKVTVCLEKLLRWNVNCTVS